jgi:hypothetical protein
MTDHAVVERRDRPLLPLWAEVLALLAGILVAAFGLSRGDLLVAMVGFIVLLAALIALFDRFANSMNAAQPEIKPASNPVSVMKDQPAAALQDKKDAP